MTIKYKCLYEITGRIEDVNTFLVPLRELPKEPETQHWSDCAVHSEPAYPKGECDCGGYKPEQEPVASIFISGIGEREFDDWGHDLPVGRNLLYTTTTPRTWVGLTDEEAHELWESTDSDDDWELMKRTEAKLKEKNT